ncbi:uncharacterized protein [Montipora capricornis]|uniref:uncharacterized protein isoform X2 n=1 Tax=Montipora capricornis TaxID=246305 RepID=UPI0035F20A01
MAVLRLSMISGLFFLLIATVESRTCAFNEYIIESTSGSLTCFKCPSCLPGFGLYPQCGDKIKQSELKIECQRCKLGETYSAHNDIGSCQPCSACSVHQTVVKNCTLTNDSQCDDTCAKGFYYEGMSGDCQPCSWCCPDGSNEVKSQCKDMPFYTRCNDVGSMKSCKPKCQTDQYVVPDSKRKGGHCIVCPDCSPGSSPFPECGSVIENTNNVNCRECVKGKTFSDKDGKSPCKPCTRCSFGQLELVPCSLTNDRVCSNISCDKGFYRDNTSTECKPCSACCNDGKDVLVKRCADEKMTNNLQCSYRSTCQQQALLTKESKRFIPVFVAAVVIAVLATSLLIVLYVRRLKLRRHKDLSTHQSLSLLIPPVDEESIPTTFEDPTVKGQQETLSFEKCGVILQFSDPESFGNDAQGVRLKICWDKASTDTLPSHEIQLSPVIKFHPHASKLSKPVCVRIPHSAFVFFSHGWNIQLKSSMLENGAIVWKEEAVGEIHNNEVSFYTDCLLSYVVVGMSVNNSNPTKKRFQGGVIGGEGKVGENYAVYLYVFDDCEASLEKIMQEEISQKRNLLGSLQSLYVESVLETDIKIAVKQIIGGWNIGHTNPRVISHKSLKESYRSMPCAEILFEHDNGRNRDFRCTLELTAADTTIQVRAVASIKEDPFRRFKESHPSCMVSGRSLSDPITKIGDKPPLLLKDLPVEMIHNVCGKLDHSQKGISNWQQVGEQVGITKQLHGGAWKELMTAGKSPTEVLLEYLQTELPQLTVAEFVQTLRAIERFDVVEILKPYTQGL